MRWLNHTAGQLRGACTQRASPNIIYVGTMKGGNGVLEYLRQLLQRDLNSTFLKIGHRQFERYV